MASASENLENSPKYGDLSGNLGDDLRWRREV